MGGNYTRSVKAEEIIPLDFSETLLQPRKSKWTPASSLRIDSVEGYTTTRVIFREQM